jgi:uncharacterized coiled-coil DUF342 family protein
MENQATMTSWKARADKYRDLAEEARQQAEKLRTPGAQVSARIIARGYEELAATMERLAAIVERSKTHR